MPDRMPCSISDGTKADDEQIRNQPDPDSIDSYRGSRAQIIVRLGHTIEHIGRHSSFDKKELIQLLKDAKRDLTPIMLRERAE